jgi:putative spermidine/putrescine transport system substrate-binding protein
VDTSSGKVQAINTALIPSWDSLDPRLKDSPVLTMNSIHYGVPFQWGENVLMYNTEVFDGAPASWDIVFEENMLPDGQTNKGRVQAYESPIYIADAALYLKYQRPELGISDPYELTREQFSAVIDLLRKQRVLVNRYWQDAFVQVDDFESKKAAISGSWPFQVKELKRAGQPIASSIPVEGVTGRMDSLMLDAHAPHPNIFGWNTRLTLKSREISQPGLVPIHLYLKGARRVNCSALRAAKPTDTITWTESFFGKRLT